MTWQQKSVFWLLYSWLETPNDWPNFSQMALDSWKTQSKFPCKITNHTVNTSTSVSFTVSVSLQLHLLCLYFQARKFAPTLFNSYTCVALYTIMQIHKYTAKCLHCSQFSVLNVHMYLAYSDSLPTNLLKCWANNNIWRGQPWTLKFCQREQQNSTVSVV